MDNNTIVRTFDEIGDILDVQGADFFRVNAYKKAALIILNLPYDLRDVVEKNPNDLSKIPGIGKGLQQKIIELIQTGKCKEFEEIKKGFPEGLLEMLRIRGLGPKKVRLLHLNLGIKNLKELEAAAKKHLIQSIPGMGKKSEDEILKAIEEYSHFSTTRSLLSDAFQEAIKLIDYMKKCDEVSHIEYAGSLRRFEETIGDIDILVTVKNAKKSTEIIMKYFISYKEVLNVVAEGNTKSAVILSSGMHVDLRVIENESFGAALHYFTGSKEHNIKIRDLAKKKGLKVSEYGVFKGDKMIGGLKEKDIFDAVGLPFIVPEIRRNEGEIEYGLKHKKFPTFVELKDIKGDLHSHSTYSDGEDTIEEMANAFIDKGYEYFAVTDHSSVLKVTSGMGKNDIKKQWKEIDGLNKKLEGKIKILKGVEVDILKDGSLDFEDEVLKNLDVVIISAHMYGHLSFEEQTNRLIAAIENPYSMILGHPTGRLINRRAPMEFDMEKIIEACVSNKVAIEINSNPIRLDLADKYVKIAKDKGAKFVISTDSHNKNQIPLILYGVEVARRGWLEKSDVINSKSFGEFDSYF